jgi:uncharacterized protein
MENSKNKWYRYVILLSNTNMKASYETIKQHVEHIKKLDDENKLIICGPFNDYDGGIIVINVDSYKEAKNIAENDPFIKQGVRTYEIRTLEMGCKENNYLLD